MSATAATLDGNPELTTVYLVGALGRAMGCHVWKLDVKSTSEAIRAININTRGKLEQYLAGPAREQCYQIALQKRTNVIDPKEMSHRSGRGDIYIMPTIQGRNSGVGKIITGVALVALALVSQQYELLPYAWSAVGTTAWATAGTIAIGFGASLILGGITQLLTPTPQGPSAAGEDPKSSTFFQGNATSVVQGGCVPLVYGRALVSPIPISITLENSDVPTTDAGYTGTVTTTNLNGGGVQETSATDL